MRNVTRERKREREKEGESEILDLPENINYEQSKNICTPDRPMRCGIKRERDPMDLLAGKIIAVITIGASGRGAAFAIFSRIMGRGPRSLWSPRIETSSTFLADNYRTVREGHVYVTSAHYIWQLLAA